MKTQPRCAQAPCCNTASVQPVIKYSTRLPGAVAARKHTLVIASAICKPCSRNLRLGDVLSGERLREIAGGQAMLYIELAWTPLAAEVTRAGLLP